MINCDIFFTVRYAETDQMGIVHHSNYPVWFEAGRTDYIKHIGQSYSSIENRGLLLPLIELRCIYKGAARYEDTVAVRTTLSEMTPLRVHFSYRVFVLKSEDETDIGIPLRMSDDIVPICEGDTYHVWTDSKLKPVDIRKHDPELYISLLEAMNCTADVPQGFNQSEVV